MRMRVLFAALAVTALAASPAIAQTTYYYEMTGEQQIHTPLGVSSFAAGTWEGPQASAVVTDNGDGTVTLERLISHNNLENEFDASGTSVADCFATTNSNVQAIAGTPHGGSIAGGGALGTGDVTFGTISGWQSLGNIYCFERLYSGTTSDGQPILPVLEVGTCGGCQGAAGLQHDGYGPGPGISPDHNTDGWTFAGDQSSLDINSTLQFFTTLGGVVWGEVHGWHGTQVPSLPALLPLGAAALGLGLTFIGARRLRDQ
jgi:hypothetical protein